MTTGAAQTLLRSYGVLPGRRVLVAGNGPLNLQVALELARAGAEVVALAELARRQDRPTPPRSGAWRRARRACSATGSATCVRCAATASGPATATCWRGSSPGCGLGWRQLGVGREEPFDGGRRLHGLRLPARERAPARARLPARFRPGARASRHCTRRGVRDERRRRLRRRRLLRPRRCAGGRGGGPDRWSGGGRFARPPLPEAVRRERDRARSRLRRHRRFQQGLWQLYAAPRHQHELADAATPVCRCEEVTLGEVEAALADGQGSMGEVKRCTRLGMGACQGRYCAPVLAAPARRALRPAARRDGLLRPPAPGQAGADRRAGAGAGRLSRAPCHPSPAGLIVPHARRQQRMGRSACAEAWG